MPRAAGYFRRLDGEPQLKIFVISILVPAPDRGHRVPRLRVQAHIHLVPEQQRNAFPEVVDLLFERAHQPLFSFFQVGNLSFRDGQLGVCEVRSWGLHGSRVRTSGRDASSRRHTTESLGSRRDQSTERRRCRRSPERDT